MDTQDKIRSYRQSIQKFHQDLPNLDGLLTAAFFGSYGHGKSALGDCLYSILKNDDQFRKPFSVGSSTATAHTMTWDSTVITVGPNSEHGVLKLFDNKGLSDLDKKTIDNVKDQLRGRFKEGEAVKYDAKHPFYVTLWKKIDPFSTLEPIDCPIFVFSAESRESIAIYKGLIQALKQGSLWPLVVITHRDLANRTFREYVADLNYDPDFVFLVHNYCTENEFRFNPRPEDNLEFLRLFNRILITAQDAHESRKNRKTGLMGECNLL